MIALATAQAVIALRGHSWVALGWLSAMAVFLVVTTVSSNDLFLRVELGLVAGSLTACLIFAYALRARIHAGAIPDAESMLDGVIDSPFEG
jgi:hypothetical protein